MFEVFLTILAMAAQAGGTGADGEAIAATSGAAGVAVGSAAGVQALIAEPQDPSGRFTTAVEVKPILTATRGNWVAVREYGGQDLLYVTHLWSWRCGLLEIRIGLNGAAPEVWPLPACHMDQPMPGVVLEQDGLPYRGFEAGSIRSVEVQITYDDLSTDTATFERSAVLMP